MSTSLAGICSDCLTLRTDATSESKGGAGDVSHAQSPIREPFRGEEIGEAKLTPVGVGEVAE